MAESVRTTEARPGFQTLRVKSLAALQSLYMPFIRNGGVFLPSRRRYQLGDPLFVLLYLPDAGEPAPLAGHVVWIMPADAQGMKRGVGLQLSQQDGGALRRRIEALLASASGLRERRRYTL